MELLFSEGEDFASDNEDILPNLGDKNNSEVNLHLKLLESWNKQVTKYLRFF